MKCFNCEQDGHMAWQCPWKHELSGIPDPIPADSTPTPPPFDPTRQEGRPPTAGYLAERERLGMPSDPQAIALLEARCPWCDSGPWQHCLNRALGTVTPFHEARWTAAGMQAPRRAVYADVARRQVDEIRTEREKANITG